MSRLRDPFSHSSHLPTRGHSLHLYILSNFSMFPASFEEHPVIAINSSLEFLSNLYEEGLERNSRKSDEWEQTLAVTIMWIWKQITKPYISGEYTYNKTLKSSS